MVDAPPATPRAGAWRSPLLPPVFSGFHPPRWWWHAAFALSLAPLLYLIPLFVAYAQNAPPESVRYLGTEPIKAVEHFTGEWTLRFLMFTLAVTPIRQLIGWNWLGRYRRMIGLFAFFYACVHLVIFGVLDLELVWGDLGREIEKRPYLLVGMSALLTMAPLAITSTRGMVKRLGGHRWARLHKLIYLVVILGTIHFFMSVKKDIDDPIMFASIFAGLLAYRLWEHTRTWDVVRERLTGAPRSRR